MKGSRSCPKEEGELGHRWPFCCDRVVQCDRVAWKSGGRLEVFVEAAVPRTQEGEAQEGKKSVYLSDEKKRKTKGKGERSCRRTSLIFPSRSAGKATRPPLFLLLPSKEEKKAGKKRGGVLPS